MGTFDRRAAVAYAYKYAINANPDYPNLAWGRGDCTNFISQSMLAGGWPMVWGPKGNDLCWFTHSKEERTPGLWDNHIRPYFSDTWATAAKFANFIERTRRAEICTREDLEMGDIVSIAPFGGNIEHNMIVTNIASGFYGKVIYVSYHSKFRLNEPLEKIEANYQDQWSFYWKVAPSFADFVDYKPIFFK